MSGRLLDLNEPPEGDVGEHYVLLQKDNKPICRTRCSNFRGHSIWTITEFRPKSTYHQSNWPRYYMYPEHENSHQKKEWGVFLHFLWKNKRVAVVNFECCSFYILAPDECWHYEVEGAGLWCPNLQKWQDKNRLCWINQESSCRE